MKTAMQELVEHIQINATKFSLMNTYNILKEIEPYLEKEKKQIIDAYYGGVKLLSGDIESAAKHYYYQTYNQNK
jgi:hypothetical protein